jgi:hypothetical protein
MSFFFIYKFGEQGVRTGLAWVVGTSERGEELGKRYGRVNIVQTLCTHVCKWKNDIC